MAYTHTLLPMYAYKMKKYVYEKGVRFFVFYVLRIFFSFIYLLYQEYEEQEFAAL